MSGRHPARLASQPLRADRRALLPAMLKRRGYHTAILGKWHLAGYPMDFTTSPMHPLECGFDHHFDTPGSNDVPAPPGKKQTRHVFDTAGKFSFPVNSTPSPGFRPTRSPASAAPSPGTTRPSSSTWRTTSANQPTSPPAIPRLSHVSSKR
jgi:arylsulfatase A-like enzyme